MLTHLIHSALRVFKRQKILAIINLFGFSLGLCSAFIISLYVLDELRYDRFHQNKERIYRVINETIYKDGSPKVPIILSDYIINNIPEVEKVVSIRIPRYTRIKHNGEFLDVNKFITVSDQFFKVFSFDFLEGNPNEALTDIHSIVITKSTSAKYFPGESAIGKTLEMNDGSEDFLLTVSGVIEDIPKLSSIQADFIGNIELSLLAFERQSFKDIRTNWGLPFFETYVLLQQNTSRKSVEEKLLPFERFYLQPLTDIHLKSSHLINADVTGNIDNVKLFSGIGIGVLLIACFNYIILSMGQSSSRSKEIGIRKVIGASRKDIVLQFLIESIIMSLIALLPAIFIIKLLLPKINQLFQTNLEFTIWTNQWVIILFISITILVAIFSGGHISLIISRLNPIQVLKSNKIKNIEQVLFQRILITFEIFAFVTLTSSTLIIVKQIQFGLNKDFGFNKDNLAYMKISRNAIVSNFEIFKYKLLQNQYITSVTAGDVPPSDDMSFLEVPRKDDPDQLVRIEGIDVDFDFIQMLNIAVIQGRSFDINFPADSNKIILNQEAVEALHLNNPIGEIIDGREVIGVVKNFNIHSVHSIITPLLIEIANAKYINKYLIKYEPGRFVQARDHCYAVLSKMAPDSDFHFQLFSDALGNLYAQEFRLKGITMLFGSFAILIAMLGLFGHSFFAAKKITHEIGVRKVFGAQSRDIIKLFGKGFLILIIIANIVSYPVTNLFMNKWLQNFAYKVEISGRLFVIVFFFSALVVGITVSSHAWKIMRINPKEIFRHE